MYRDRLIAKLEQLDKEMNAMFEKLRSYDDETLTYQPDEGIWSPMQILNHLILAEKWSLAYCIKKLSFNPELKKVGLRTRFNDKLVSLALASPFKFKAPKIVDSENLDEFKTLEEVLGQWSSVRREVLDFIQSTPEKYIQTEVYKHPFGLRLSIGGMLDFYKAHFRRHRRQIFRRLS